MSDLSEWLRENIEQRGPGGLFNVESASELELLARVADDLGVVARACIRVNPDVDARTHAKIATGKSENKFGIPISRARGVYARAPTLGGLRVVGVDMHIGSQITEIRKIKAAIQEAGRIYAKVRKMGVNITHLDVGGGASAEMVENGFRIILSDPNVKGILINILNPKLTLFFLAFLPVVLFFYPCEMFCAKNDGLPHYSLWSCQAVLIRAGLRFRIWKGVLPCGNAPFCFQLDGHSAPA